MRRQADACGQWHLDCTINTKSKLLFLPRKRMKGGVRGKGKGARGARGGETERPPTSNQGRPGPTDFQPVTLILMSYPNFVNGPDSITASAAVPRSDRYEIPSIASLLNVTKPPGDSVINDFSASANGTLVAVTCRHLVRLRCP